MTGYLQVSAAIFSPCELTAASAETGNAVTSEIQLLPIGSFRGKDGRGPWQVKDLAHAQRIVKASQDRAGQSQIAIDYDHQIINAPKNGAPAPAAGWITAMRAQADGIWATVEWTPRAREQLGQREYRYLSPVFRHDRFGTVSCIVNAALTNVPALDLRAVASQQGTSSMNDETALRIRALCRVSCYAEHQMGWRIFWKWSAQISPHNIWFPGFSQHCQEFIGNGEVAFSQSWRICFGESFEFFCWIGPKINFCALHAGVTKPKRDLPKIARRLQGVHCTGVTQNMRADVLFCH